MGLVERVRTLCEASLSDRVLRDRVVRELGRAMAFDAHLLVITDPVSGVVSSPHVDVPMVPRARLADLIRHRYLVPADDWAAWLGAEYGIAGTVTVPLADRYGNWGFLELWRAGAPFDRAEHDVLAAAAATLTRGLRLALARTFVLPEGRAGTAGAPLPAPVGGVILVGDDLRVRAETDAAARALLELLPPSEEVPPVPAIAFNVAAALLAAQAPGRPRATAPWTRAHLGGSRWVTAHAERAADLIVVSIGLCPTVERVDLFARCHGFSPREVEVFDLVLRGSGSRQIAEALTIAPTTAEDHLRALLAKSRTDSRQELVLRAVGAGAVRTT